MGAAKFDPKARLQVGCSNRDQDGHLDQRRRESDQVSGVGSPQGNFLENLRPSLGFQRMSKESFHGRRTTQVGWGGAGD